MVEATALTILLVGSLSAFAMLFSLGGNDVANSIGLAIGSKAISTASAIGLAALMNVLGAALAGGRVTSTVADHVVPPLASELTQASNALAYLVTLIAAVLVISCGTLLKLPLSSTHAIVGGLIGAGMLLYSPQAVRWQFVRRIAMAWVISPLLGGVICLIIRVILRMAAFNFAAYATFVPLLAAANAMGALCVLLFLGPSSLQSVLAPRPWLLVVELAVMFTVAFLVTLLHIRNKFKTGVDAEPLNKSIEDPIYGATNGLQSQTTDEGFEMDENAAVFKGLLVLTVPAVAFAHGSNDVSNGVGPFLGILRFFFATTGRSLRDSILLLVLLAGGVSIGLGITLFGHHVIDTIGRGGIYRAEWTFARAFAAQAAAAIAVLVASFFGLPVSTSHTIVGAVIFAGIPVGWNANGEVESGGLNGKMVRDIALGAVLTPVFAGVVAAALMYVVSLIGVAGQ